MPIKTTSFNKLTERAHQRNPNWGANVAEYRRAMEDALALAELRNSTLRSYIEALGGHLEITAVFDDDRRPIAVGPSEG